MILVVVHLCSRPTNRPSLLQLAHLVSMLRSSCSSTPPSSMWFSVTYVHHIMPRGHAVSPRLNPAASRRLQARTLPVNPRYQVDTHPLACRLNPKPHPAARPVP